MAREVKAWVDDKGNMHRTKIKAERADLWDEAIRLIEELGNNPEPHDILNKIDNHGDFFLRFIQTGQAMLKETFEP